MSNSQNQQDNAQFCVDTQKFINMLMFITEVRKAQTEYFKSKSKESLVHSKQLEARLDKAVKFYLDNKAKLYSMSDDMLF